MAIKAVVTGHSKGLGAGIAQALLGRNIPVLGISRSPNALLAQQFPLLLQEIRIDLSESAALEGLQSNNLLKTFIVNTTLLLLINNAGSVTPVGPLASQSAISVARSIQLNVTAPLAMSAMLADLVKHPQELRILHVSSGAGQSPYPGWSVYCATKAALDMHARAVQQDHVANIKICSLAPGVIDTDMQAEIRSTDEALFPNKQRFIALKNDNALSSPQATGQQLLDYLLASKFGNLAVDDLRSHRKN